MSILQGLGGYFSGDWISEFRLEIVQLLVKENSSLLAQGNYQKLGCSISQWRNPQKTPNH